jgi:hypothetical protein
MMESGTVMDIAKKEVFVSYTHADKEISDAVCIALSKAEAIKVIRDEDALKYKDSLSEFMLGIRDTDYAVFIISQAFLKRPSCMNELLGLLKEKNFHDKALPILTDHSLYEEENKDDLYLFWDKKIEDLNKKIREGYENKERDAPKHLTEERTKARCIRNQLEQVLSFIEDKYLKTFDELRSTSFKELFDSMGIELPLALVKAGEAAEVIIDGFEGEVRIIRGNINYRECSVNIPAISQLNVSIIGGEIYKKADGRIGATVKTMSPYTWLQDINKKIGLDVFDVVSEVTHESIVNGTQYKFVGTREAFLPANEPIVDMNTWEEVTYPIAIPFQTRNEVIGILDGNIMRGEFTGTTTFVGAPPIVMKGAFEIYLGTYGALLLGERAA